jgi:hypothetical protein
MRRFLAGPPSWKHAAGQRTHRDRGAFSTIASPTLASAAFPVVLAQRSVSAPARSHAGVQ